VLETLDGFGEKAQDSIIELAKAQKINLREACL
jgi:hypothetical protein